MHVSPFNPMDMAYRWCSNNPARVLSLNLETERQGEIHTDATMALKRREINRGQPEPPVAAASVDDGQGGRFDLLAGAETVVQTQPDLRPSPPGGRMS